MRLSLSLGAWWPGGRSSSSVSQFLPSCSGSACQMAVKWKDGYQGDLSLWGFLQLCFCSVLGRCPAERGEQTLRCAQLSARLSVELCSPDLMSYHTTLRCTESVHFLWPLNRKFSGLLVRPWISSAVADGTVCGVDCIQCHWIRVLSITQLKGEARFRRLQTTSLFIVSIKL